MSNNNFPINQFFNTDSTELSKLVNKKNVNINKFLQNTTDKPLINQIVSDNYGDLTEQLLILIEKEVGEEKFITIFKNLSIITINDKEILFKPASTIQRLFIEENYLNILKLCCDKLNINKILKFTDSSQVLENTTQKIKKPLNKFSFKLNNNLAKEAPKTKEIPNINIYKSKFIDIIEGSFNKLAITSLKQCSISPGKIGKYPFIYLYGQSGVGKTQLIDAVFEDVIHNYPEYRILKVTSRQFVKDVMSSYRNNKLEEFNFKYNENIDVLIFDEIQDLKNKDGSQNKFYHLFNDLFYKGKQIIICGDMNPKSLEGFSDKLRSRLQWGLIVKIDQPDFDTRVKILKDKSSQVGLFLNDEVVNFLASYYKDSIRELEGAVLSLSAYTEIMNIEIDLELAKEQLSIKQIENLVTMDEILFKTADHFNLGKSDLLSKSRKKEHATARHIAWYLTREILNTNLLDIALFYNRKEHSSVLHGVNKINSLLKCDVQLAKTVFKIKTSL